MMIFTMTDDAYIPIACLSDARKVLAAQDPEISQLAERWLAAQWRAAVKATAVEMEPCK
ncbi:hypothetical protein PIGHUM_02929 [Pigmentiphaga humi]|uniref:Uncharacterized protein n=2 Tax=Pigmentiphaga humi TaxID=2478468 RepID=A0A3P4B5B2_9BURK|nr:hypothetical protein PIGHUM_02929 [Pigmentiphaga humi]